VILCADKAATKHHVTPLQQLLLKVQD